MLGLQSVTPPEWVDQVQQNLEEVLIDHAHCEKKAAGTAMNLLFAYVRPAEICQPLSEIVVEELEHFNQVLELLQRRGIRYRKLKPSTYGRDLHELIRHGEPQRAVDRLLVAGLIEARSCERFGLLRQHLADEELVRFYDDLFESEARHHSTYLRLASAFMDQDHVKQRWRELAGREAEIIATGSGPVRMHSPATATGMDA